MRCDFTIPSLRRARALAMLALWLPLSLSQAVAGGKAYTYQYLGNPAAAVKLPQPTTPSVVLMGGGYDVGAAFRWLITRAGIQPGTGGRFVVIRASGTDAYNPYIYSRLGTVDTTTPMSYENVGGIDLGLTSVETLVISSRAAANDPFVLSVINAASVIWIAGGNQADYFNDWQGTSLQTALNNAIARNVPVGGTSAGNAILGQFAFVALNGSVTSSQALANPFNRQMTFDPLNVSGKSFTVTGSLLSIPMLTNVITDDHVNTQDRVGRMMAFAARIGNGCPPASLAFYLGQSIGIDEETALLVSGDGTGGANVQMAVNPFNAANFASGLYTPANSAYFVTYNTVPATCSANAPLLAHNGSINVYRMSDPSPKPPGGTAPYSSYIANVQTKLNSYGGLVLNLYGTANGAVQYSGGKQPY